MRFLPVLLALSVAACASPSNAQSPCGPRDGIIKLLEQRYAEKPQALGLASNGSVLEVTVSPKGSWTLILTSPDGKTCIIGSGEAWTILQAIQGQPA